MSLTAKDFIRRRQILVEKVDKGIILISANQLLPRNYEANSFPFRQDSTFLYYTGINEPDLFLLIDCQSGDMFLAGEDPTVEDTIWSGSQKKIKELAEESGIDGTLSVSKLKAIIDDFKAEGHFIHFLPPYTARKTSVMSELIGIPYSEIKSGASKYLIEAVIEQRSVKEEEEIAEIESALDQVTGPMHMLAMKMAVEGNFEYQIVAEMYKAAKAKDLEFAYPVICSVHGEILHNESHQNKLGKGQLLLIDAGVESINHYASDITRTTPVGGKFSTQQKEIYGIVLAAQLKAIENLKPGIRFIDVHLEAARNLAIGLDSLGLMKGDVDEAIRAGAHALFFPHGLGHMLGLDVHDMEDLGEDRVGYDEHTLRSNQFGTAYLRLARELKPDFVLTVEPGVYFIPALIEQWQHQKKYEQYINYAALSGYMNFGGIRIEDNIAITKTGHRLLGKPIVKTIEDIQAL